MWDVKESDLSSEEIQLLDEQSISIDEIYDGRFSSWESIRYICKLLSKEFVFKNPCKKCGRRIRTRSGHCIRCKRASITYQRRHRKAGYIYVAHSRKEDVFKIGFTECLAARERSLNAGKEGGIDDWCIIGQADVREGGKIEREMHRYLSLYISERHTWKEGALRKSKEMFSCEIENIKEAAIFVVRFEPEISFLWADSYFCHDEF